MFTFLLRQDCDHKYNPIRSDSDPMKMNRIVSTALILVTLLETNGGQAHAQATASTSPAVTTTQNQANITCSATGRSLT